MMSLPVVVLDACVLANYSLCDTLLRLAEPPRLFVPKWSEIILNETVRTLETKLGWPAHLVRHFRSQMDGTFDEASVGGFESLISRMPNDEKDRHVLAAAVQSKASFIVTFNLRHFSPHHLDPWAVRAIHPQVLLTLLFRNDSQMVVSKLKQQAQDRNRTLAQLLMILKKTVPEFAGVVSGALARQATEKQ